MTDVNPDDEIQARLAQIERDGAFRHYRPLHGAADEFIRWASNPAERVYTGIPELDAAMRGTAPGELTLIQGFTHSGKTLLGTEVLLNNEETPFLVFTPDETRPAVLLKLASALHGVGAEELERRIYEDDVSAREILHSTADRYGKLAIFDESVSVVDMDIMMRETEQAFQMKLKAVMFDYAELLEGGDDVKGKITALKQWGKRHGVSLFLLHQTSRTAGAAGKKMQIDSGSFGGEQQATHVIGVRRKKYMHMAMVTILEDKIANASNPTAIEQYRSRIQEILQIDLPRDADTITVSLNKNKRPPMKLVDDIDYTIDQQTGRIIRQPVLVEHDGQKVRVNKSAALTYLRQRKEEQSVQEALDEIGADF